MAYPAASASILSDVLHRELAQSKDGSRVWLLVDPSAGVRDAADDELATALQDAGAHPSVVNTGSRLDASLMPQLFLLHSERSLHSAALLASVEQALLELDGMALTRGEGRRICGWLQSNESASALSRHIARHLIQYRPPLGRPALWRWIDPAALWAFWPVLSPQQQAALLGPIRTYRMLDPAAGFVTLHGSGCAPHTPMNLSMAQWADADSIGALNEALRLRGAHRLDPVSLTSARDGGMAATRRARQRGRLHSRDLTEFARLAMTVHPQFDAHPLIQKRLDAAADEDRIGALFDDLNDDDWQRVRAEAGRSAMNDTSPRIR